MSKEPKKDKSKRRRIVSDDDSNNEVKKNKSKRLRIGSDDSDEVVKKVKSKRLHVVSDDEIDDVVKKDTPKKSVVISDESDDDVMMANTESPDDLMVVDVRLGGVRGRPEKAQGEKDKEGKKSKRKEIPPAIVNDDGICLSNNGQYCLDMSKRYELSGSAIEWTHVLCNQNKVQSVFSLKLILWIK